MFPSHDRVELEKIVKKVIVEVPEDYTRILYKKEGDEYSLYYAKESIFTPDSKLQQPTVPVQFVVVSNVSDEERELLTNALSCEKTFFCGDTYEVEQIGAVLYVRGK